MTRLTSIIARWGRRLPERACERYWGACTIINICNHDPFLSMEKKQPGFLYMPRLSCPRETGAQDFGR